jgi:hypothetical protein
MRLAQLSRRVKNVTANSYAASRMRILNYESNSNQLKRKATLMSKLNWKKGFYGEVSDDEAFLTPDNTDPHKASASDVGYNSRWASGDDAGDGDSHGAGEYAYDAACDSFLKPSYTGDVDYAHQGLGGIVDDVDGMGSGNKLTSGGGPLSKDYGVNDGKPRYGSKNVGASGQINRDSRGGRDRAGGRR